MHGNVLYVYKLRSIICMVTWDVLYKMSAVKYNL